jgi:hypothetical protein
LVFAAAADMTGAKPAVSRKAVLRYPFFLLRVGDSGAKKMLGRGVRRVAEASRDEHTIDDLIAALERASEGNTELDRMVAFQLGLPIGESDQMIKLLLFEGYSWDVISELVQSENPSFTTALDARIPGENVVLAMRSAKRGQWAAIHRGAGGTDFIAWAASEALARRAAALRGLRAVSAFDSRSAVAAAPAMPAKFSPGETAPLPDAVARRSATNDDGSAAATGTDGALFNDPMDGPGDGPGDGRGDTPARNGEWKILF